MNWQEVKKNQSIAYDKLLHTVLPPNIRDLYDFFDEQGIKVFIMPDSILFKWEIWGRTELLAKSTLSYGFRTSTEEEAFLKAFQLLEQKLREGR